MKGNHHCTGHGTYFDGLIVFQGVGGKIAVWSAYSINTLGVKTQGKNIPKTFFNQLAAVKIDVMRFYLHLNKVPVLAAYIRKFWTAFTGGK